MVILIKTLILGVNLISIWIKTMINNFQEFINNKKIIKEYYLKTNPQITLLLLENGFVPIYTSLHGRISYFYKSPELLEFLQNQYKLKREEE